MLASPNYILFRLTGSICLTETDIINEQIASGVIINNTPVIETPPDATYFNTMVEAIKTQPSAPETPKYLIHHDGGIHFI